MKYARSILLVVLYTLLSFTEANVGLSLGGRKIPNHGLVYFEDIGVDRNAANLSIGLACWTNATSDVCCEDFMDPELQQCGKGGTCRSGTGSWLLPFLFRGGTNVYIRRQVDGLSGDSNDGYGIHRDGNAVYLFRNRAITRHPGLWRCVIPDTSGTDQTLFIGIYPQQGTNGTIATTQSGLHYSVVSEDPLMFTLTLNTRGGPTTYVTWTRDDVDITTLSNMMNSTSSLPMIDDMTMYGDSLQGLNAAMYTNILTVTERRPGVYEVSVTNDRNGLGNAVVRNITVLDLSPRDLTINRTGPSSIYVAWTQTDMTRYFSGYEYQLNSTYMMCTDVEGCTRTTNITVINTSTLQQAREFNNIPLWSLVNITVRYVTMVRDLRRYAFLPNQSISANYILSGVSAPLNVSIQLLDATSVMVTWTHPDQGLSADEYIVSYQRINGTDGQCSTYQHEGNISTKGKRNDHTINNLEEFSNYVFSISVGNREYNLRNMSKTRHTTPSAAPSGPPQNLTIANMTTTSITITWESVECIHRNGLITHYIIYYGLANTQNVSTTSTEHDSEDVFTATINDTKEYVLKVAAVNSAGTGPFATIDTGSESSGSGSVVSGVVTVLVLIVVGTAATFAIVGVIMWFRRKQRDLDHEKPAFKFIETPNSGIHTSDVKERDLQQPSPKAGTPDEKKRDIQQPILPKEAIGTPDMDHKKMKIPTHIPPTPGKKPSIKEFPEDTHITEGQEVVLEVTVSDQPEPSLTWYHNGEELVADYSLEIDQDGRVYIPSSELRHSGVYKLVVKNDHGSNEREMTVYIHSESEGINKKKMDLSPVLVDEFGSYVSKHHECFHEGFKDMYQCLYDGSDHSIKIGLSLGNKKLNRFANITVYDDNRIELSSSDGYENTFVNACYVDGYITPRKYIATQGPLPKTVDDFWRLVWQEKIPTIVMITNLKEGDKVKCQQYWPDSGTQVYGPVEVTISDQQILADYVIRTFFIKPADISLVQQLKVTQYHFTSWPDHGVPTYATSVLTFHKRAITEHKQRAKKGPMLVHCSAGVGRTGTFIAIDWVLEQVEKEKIVDIAGTVNKMRQQRMKMVQTADQFIFIHDAILESVTCGNTQINVADLRLAVKRMLKTDPTTKKTHFELQYDVLEQMSPNPKDSQKYCSSALKYPEKNRKMEYLPSENHRVALIGEYPDYINATNVNGYKQKNAYIIAEGPMESTARNFWKIICDRKCGAIIMLSNIIEQGEETSCQYWPSGEEEARFGEYTIEQIKKMTFDGYTTRKLSVTTKNKPPHEVMQFHITNWGVDGKCSDLSSITEVIEKVTKAQMRSGNKPIVVHCSDTVGRSGIFCAISSAIEQCKSEGVVDVFQVIKAMRVQKPGAVLNVEQYQLVYDVVMTFLDSFDMYANFQQM